MNFRPTTFFSVIQLSQGSVCSATGGTFSRAADVIDLHILQDAVDRAAPHKQSVLVSINFGNGAGEWVYEEPHACTRFPYTMKGQKKTMPLGFDPAYKQKVDDFLKQLTKRFDKNSAISGFVMTGAGTLGIEFHVVETTEDIDAWEAAAREADFDDKHEAIRLCAEYRMDAWAAMFPKTTLLFCGGNPWSNQTGKADEEWAFDYAKSLSCGICTEYHKGNPAFTEEGKHVDYPYCEEPVAPTSSPDSIQGPLPSGMSAVHCVLMTAVNKGAQMCELWEEDCVDQNNWTTITEDSKKLSANA